VCALFIVRDEGAGMSAGDLKVLFLPFGRGARAHHMAKGTGLGMCVVREIVEAHGGTIDVQSQLGQGTTMAITLPLARR
jgi:signal transduction histidine kinase